MNTKTLALFFLLLPAARSLAMDTKDQQSKIMTADEYRSHLQKRQDEIIKKYLALVQKLSHKSRLTKLKEFILKKAAEDFDYLAAQQLTHEEYQILSRDLQTGNLQSFDALPPEFGLSVHQIEMLKRVATEQALERMRARDTEETAEREAHPERFSNIDNDFGPIKPPCGCCGS